MFYFKLWNWIDKYINLGRDEETKADNLSTNVIVMIESCSWRHLCIVECFTNWKPSATVSLVLLGKTEGDRVKIIPQFHIIALILKVFLCPVGYVVLHHCLFIQCTSRDNIWIHCAFLPMWLWCTHFYYWIDCLTTLQSLNCHDMVVS